MSERKLLQLGNEKLGSSIHNWGLPAGLTCPGATEVCQANCYAKIGRYCFAKVQDKLSWNYEQALSRDFVERMIHEIKSEGVLVLRVHTSGDYFSRQYAERWLIIMSKVPKVRYYWYTRSWRVPDIEPVLRKMAGLKSNRGWYSVDKEANVKAPKNIRLAYLQTEEEVPPPTELVLRVRRLRKSFALPVVCPAETVAGKGTPCATCQRCFR